MHPPIPPTVHDEIATLDRIEQEMVRLTTADLGLGRTSGGVRTTLALPSSMTFKTVIPAQAGTYTESPK
jgi:hypothetical protein